MNLVYILLFVVVGSCIFILAPIIISRRKAGRAVCPKCQRPANCFFDKKNGTYWLSCACGRQERVASLDSRCPFCHQRH